jgi:putative toxin-antitoxin system antitoxin component (TIGR02293 family)
MDHALSFGAMLGGSRVLGRRPPRSDSGWHDVVEKGLPYRSLSALARVSALTEVELGVYLGIPKSTLNRRKHSGRFSVDESDRIYRAARIFALAQAALGDAANVAAWMRGPNEALGRAVPIALLRTEAGARQVESVLGRFLFGGYS